MSESSHGSNHLKDRWFCVLSALAVFAAVVSTVPILEMGINDDWSYAHSALQLALTGHLTYNGWGAAFLGLQALWGAGAIRMFGFSFTVLRLSILPFAMGCSIVFYLLARRVGLQPRTALLATLTLSLSPLFIPLATSFMTDVPALFFTLLALLAFVAALQTDHLRGHLTWLVAATLAAIAGGTVRQTGYITALILIPVVVFARRKHFPRPLLPTATLLWILTLLTWTVCSYWQKQQPHSVPMDMVANLCKTLFQPAGLLRAVLSVLSMISAALLLALPAGLVYVVAYIQTSGVRRFVVALLFAILLSVVVQPVAGPLMGNTITKYGILDSGTDALGIKPVVLPQIVRVGASLLAYLAVASAILRIRYDTRRQLPSDAPPIPVKRWEDRPVTLVLVPFSVAYLATVAVFADWIYDRYVLPLLVVLAVAFLVACQSWISSKALAAGYISLLFWALYGIAATHDYLAAGRARLAATRCIENAGIPRASISGGFEYDAWTQLEYSGHVDLRYPVRGFRLGSRPKEENFWFWDYTSHVRPRYFVVYSSQPALVMAPFPSFAYTAWLPPFRREVLVQMLPDDAGRHARGTGRTTGGH